MTSHEILFVIPDNIKLSKLFSKWVNADEIMKVSVFILHFLTNNVWFWKQTSCEIIEVKCEVFHAEYNK